MNHSPNFHIGLLKWFNVMKGYGIITNPKLGEFFIHITNFVAVPDTFEIGSAFVFLSKKDHRNERNNALNCRPVREKNDWPLIAQSLLEDDSFIRKILSENKFDAPGITSFLKSDQALTELCSNASFQLLAKITPQAVVEMIIDYFDELVDNDGFLIYAQFVEHIILKTFDKVAATSVLNQIYDHFNANLDQDLLFMVWKSKAFRFIRYSDGMDYEIPEEILNANSSSIGIGELHRISFFSFGKDFCARHATPRFQSIGLLSVDEVNQLYDYLAFLDESEQNHFKPLLDERYFHLTMVHLVDEVNELAIIETNDQYLRYKNLINLIPLTLDETAKPQIKSHLNGLILPKISRYFLIQLWLDGIFDALDDTVISDEFLKTDTTVETKINILLKLQIDQQLVLLKKHSLLNSYENTFLLLERLLIRANNFHPHFNLSNRLSDPEFWLDLKQADLLAAFTALVESDCNEIEKFHLWQMGYLINISADTFAQNIPSSDKNSFTKFFQSHPPEQGLFKDLLSQKLAVSESSELFWIYSLGLEFLDKENFKLVDNEVLSKLGKHQYFEHWKSGRMHFFFFYHLEIFLDDIFDQYVVIEASIKSGLETWESIAKLLFAYLNLQLPVTDRPTFYKQLNHIRYLIQVKDMSPHTQSVNLNSMNGQVQVREYNPGFYLEQIKSLKNSFYNIILWFFDQVETFDFEALKKKFIYFAPSDQVTILRKLFRLKAILKLDFSLDDLNDLTRFDVDLFKINQGFNPDIAVDLSTEVVIKALISLENKSRFFIGGELLSIILENLKLDKIKRFKLTDYFDECSGRQTADFDWKTYGAVKKVCPDDGVSIFEISFNYDAYLVEKVRRLPQRRWNAAAKSWIVPGQFDKEVLEFARSNSFFIDLDGSNYKNNIHLATFKRKDVPSGIQYCEGRLSNKTDELFNKDFFWCKGDKCFERSVITHDPLDWQKYSLLDFIRIFNLNADSNDSVGNKVKDGKYFEFINLINRFIRLKDHLYCDECNLILYPSDHGWFTVNNVVRFKCVNPTCSLNNREVYLNHCLNGKCMAVIDSRISKSCPNDLFICSNCGSCCSHAFFDRRLKTIDTNDMLDNPKKQWIYNQTKYKYDNKLGHLERAEYYCYKCGTLMEEVNGDVFQCSHCNVSIDTTMYKFRRPHRHLHGMPPPALNDQQGASYVSDDDIDFLF